ncbi:MAG: hypothetical protein GC162_00190 [Planctomycetes bacterium]|nr:hypothetical protein [Planctomycetota bacterium]
MAIALLCFVVLLQAATTNKSRSSESVQLFGPLTGRDMVDYMHVHESTLRAVMSNFDELMTISQKTGDKPLFPVLQQHCYQETEGTEVDAPPAP